MAVFLCSPLPSPPAVTLMPIASFTMLVQIEMQQIENFPQ
jgi:hypothetical protein